MHILYYAYRFSVFIIVDLLSGGVQQQSQLCCHTIPIAHTWIFADIVISTCRTRGRLEMFGLIWKQLCKQCYTLSPGVLALGTHTHAATNKTQHNCFAKRKPRSTLAYNRLEVTSKCLPTADRELKRAPFDGQDARTRVSHTTGVFDVAGCGE